MSMPYVAQRLRLEFTKKALVVVPPHGLLNLGLAAAKWGYVPTHRYAINAQQQGRGCHRGDARKNIHRCRCLANQPPVWPKVAAKVGLMAHRGG